MTLESANSRTLTSVKPGLVCLGLAYETTVLSTWPKEGQSGFNRERDRKSSAYCNPSSTNFLLVFTVYILQSQKNGRYYIGCTKDVAQRLQQHNLGMTNSTRNLRPWRLVYCENFDSRAEASKREALLKSWKNPKYLEQALGLSSQSTLRVSRCSSGR